MARVYEDSSDMDDDIEWVSDASDYVSDEDTLSLPDTSSLPAEILQLFGKLSKSLQTETLMEMLLMLT